MWDTRDATLVTFIIYCPLPMTPYSSQEFVRNLYRVIISNPALVTDLIPVIYMAIIRHLSFITNMGIRCTYFEKHFRLTNN
jgi:hypothetical protein